MAKFASDTNNIGNPSDEDYCKGFAKGCNGKGLNFNSANANAVINKIDQRICDLEGNPSVSYTFSNAVPNADGSACIITITGSDGSTQTSSVPKPVIPGESGTYLANVPPVIDLPAATITYQTVNDVDETPGAPVVQDISALLTFLTSPMYVAGSNITLVDNGDGTITISATDTDTDTFVAVTQDATGTTFTPADGGTPVFIPATTILKNVGPIGSSAPANLATDIFRTDDNLNDGEDSFRARFNDCDPKTQAVRIDKSDDGKEFARTTEHKKSFISVLSRLGGWGIDEPADVILGVGLFRGTEFFFDVVNPDTCRVGRASLEIRGTQNITSNGAPQNEAFNISSNVYLTEDNGPQFAYITGRVLRFAGNGGAPQATTQFGVSQIAQDDYDDILYLGNIPAGGVKTLSIQLQTLVRHTLRPGTHAVMPQISHEATIKGTIDTVGG